jgi:GDP-L-fucose synthase
MNPISNIFVAGGFGMVGSAIIRALHADGFTHVEARTKQELNLANSDAVRSFFYNQQPEYVFLAAAVVGGIEANSARPVDFLLHNMRIQNTIIAAAAEFATRKLLFLGSSCIYPKYAPQPMPESCLLTSPLEPTNEWYALAKITGLKLCQAYRKQHSKNFISAIPTNLYGSGDNYDPAQSHVIPALIRRLHLERDNDEHITVWGNPETRREFLYVDDLARALLMLMKFYDGDSWVNVGYGEDISIGEVATMIAEVVGVDPDRLVFDSSMPAGTPRKLLDSTRIFEMGWKPKTGLRTGLIRAYADFLSRWKQAQASHAARA